MLIRVTVLKLITILIVIILGEQDTNYTRYRSIKLIESLRQKALTRTKVKLFAAGQKLEDVHLSLVQLVRKYGYSIKKYEIITEDGYILKMFRIPSSGRPIFLMHGLLMSADDWITPGPENGIAYLLAAKGFDVWLGNVRGNKHSRQHVRLSVDSADFWDFSWDEMGRYDLPAMIDFVLDTTRHSQLIYVGHSQGTTVFYVMGSERPEYCHKVSLMIALAPVGAVPNLKSPFLLLVKYVSLMRPDILFAIMRKWGWNEFLPKNGAIQALTSGVCGNTAVAKIVCSNLVFSICGFSYTQLNITNLPVLFAHAPSGASTKQIEHYAQTVTFGRFQKFNYGASQNKVLYGAKIPQEYDMGIITTPMAMFYSENDWLAAQPDVLILRSKLNNVIDFYKIPDKHFNHVDFLYGIDVKHLIFTRMLKLINYYSD